MAGRQVVVISEPVPRFKVWGAEEAQTFVFDYGSYCDLLEPGDAKVPMCRAIQPSFLQLLLGWDEPADWIEVIDPRLKDSGGRGAEVRVELQTPFKPASFREFTAGISESGSSRVEEQSVRRSGSGLRQSSDEVRVKLELGDEPEKEEKKEVSTQSEATHIETKGAASGRTPVLYLSDAHCEAMLIQAFGPKSSERSAKLLRAIQMQDIKPDERGSSFSNLSVAMEYVRKWREALRWCSRQLPSNRTLVKIFLANVYPKPLAKAMYDADYQSINDCMTGFIKKFRTGVDASEVLSVYDDKPSKGEKKPSKVEAKKEQAPVAKAPAAKNPKGERPERSEEWKAQQTCFGCGMHGHIRPDCPNKKTAAQSAQPAPQAKKMGALSMGSPEEVGPFVAVDVSAVGQQGKRCLRMTGHLDGGAQCDAVGQNWVPYLELHGGIVVPLKVPQPLTWYSGKVMQESRSIVKLRVSVVGCNKEFESSFYVLPDPTDFIIVGWATQVRERMETRISDFRAVQKAQGISPVASTARDGNEVVPDMDGKEVTVDEMIFVDESVPDPAPEDTILTPAERVVVDELLEEFKEVFVAKPAGAARVEPMSITFKEGWTHPPMEPPRVHSPRVEAAIEMDIKKQWEYAVIEKSQAEYGSPVHAVVKPDSDSGYRFTLDMRGTNEGIITNPYPLPLISEVLLELREAQYIAKMDLKWGFWQFPVREEDRWKVAFRWKGDMWQYRTVCMGNTDSTNYLQRTMVRLFSKTHMRGSLVFLDDVFAYGKTWAEFLAALRAVLEVLVNANLFLKREKCTFGAREVHVLGHVVSREGVKSDSSRVDAVLAVPFPRNARELRRFLGMTNFMREYIPHYSLLAKPLSREVNTPHGEWPRADMETAFEVLKRAVAAQLSLAHLDYSVPVVVQCDASVLGLGGVLINRYPRGDRVVKCVSHAFTEAESRWKTLEQEAFAVVFTLLHFRNVLWGHYFLVETDHRNLTFIHSGTSAKVIRWSLAVQQFCFAISFIPGEQNVVADTLSRAPAGAALSVQVLRVTDFAGPATRTRGRHRDQQGAGVSDAKNSEENSSENSGEEKNSSIAPYENISPENPRIGPSDGVSDVAVDKERRSWFDSVHNETQGHMGLHATLRELQQKGLTWPRMSRDVVKWIATCALCQKYRLGGKEVLAIPSPIASFQVFEELGIDFIGPLPKDDVGNSYICNCVCMTTHYCELFAVEAATAVIAAHCLLSVVARYGCFRAVRSDRGTHFVNEVIAELLRLFEIQQVLTLAERPQANGVVERNGGEVMRHLRLLVAPKDLRRLWSVMLPLSQRIINNTWKASLGSTPHQLLHWAPTDLNRGLFAPMEEPSAVPPLSNDHVRQLQVAYERLLDETSLHVWKEQAKLLEEYQGVVPTDFAVGTYALMSYEVRPPSKLSARWAGPYRITARQGNSAVLQDLTGGKAKTVDVSRLKPFFVVPGLDVQALAGADLGEVRVEAVLAHRGDARKRGTMEFQVQWTDGDVTWEPWESVRKLAAVDEYIRAFPGKELKPLLSG